MKSDRVPVIRGAHCCGFVAGPGVAPESVTYATQHRDWHLAKFPATTPETKASLDKLVQIAEHQRRSVAS